MVVDEYSRTIFIGGVCPSISYGTCASIDEVTITLCRSCKVSTCFTISYLSMHIGRSVDCVAHHQGVISCSDELWNIFQEFGDVCGVNMPGKRSLRKHSKNRSLILSNWAFLFVCLKCRIFLKHEYTGTFRHIDRRVKISKICSTCDI